MNRLSKVVAVASVVGASMMSVQPASAGWFGMGPFGGFGWGPRPVPVGPVVPPPPYLWRIRYGVPPYGPVPPVPPAAATQAASPAEKAPEAKPAPAPEKSESKAG
jgi:hypothetical protein